MSFCALSDAKGMIINMKISSKLAQNIVQSIKEIIHHEINFMNMEGVIIASTDPVRIGQQHEGALKVLKTKRSLSLTLPQLKQWDSWVMKRQSVSSRRV